MILKYQKVTDAHTTYALAEPEYTDGQQGVTTLCEIGDDTYVHIPSDIVLPEQPFTVDTSLEAVSLTDELKVEIKEASPHVALINKRVVDRIRERYSEHDELKMHRLHLQGGAAAEVQSYFDWVDAAVAWGQAEKTKIGLG